MAIVRLGSIETKIVIILAGLLIVGLGVLALKIRTKYKFLTILFNGGQLAYDCNLATTQEVNEFQREMRLAKDKKVFEQKVSVDNKENTKVNSELKSENKLDELKKLKDLFDNSVLTEEEFNRLKKEIMGTV